MNMTRGRLQHIINSRLLSEQRTPESLAKTNPDAVFTVIDRTLSRGDEVDSVLIGSDLGAGWFLLHKDPLSLSEDDTITGREITDGLSRGWLEVHPGGRDGSDIPLQDRQLRNKLRHSATNEVAMTKRLTRRQLKLVINEELTRATSEIIREQSLPGLEKGMVEAIKQVLGAQFERFVAEVGPMVIDSCGGMLGLLRNPACVIDALIEIIQSGDLEVILDEATIAGLLEILNPARRL